MNLEHCVEKLLVDACRDKKKIIIVTGDEHRVEGLVENVYENKIIRFMVIQECGIPRHAAFLLISEVNEVIAYVPDDDY